MVNDRVHYSSKYNRALNFVSRKVSIKKTKKNGKRLTARKPLGLRAA